MFFFFSPLCTESEREKEEGQLVGIPAEMGCEVDSFWLMRDGGVPVSSQITSVCSLPVPLVVFVVEGPPSNGLGQVGFLGRANRSGWSWVDSVVGSLSKRPSLSVVDCTP